MQRQLSPRSLSVSLLTATLFALLAPRSHAGGDAAFVAPLAWKKLAAGASERFAMATAFDPKRESIFVFGGETHIKTDFGLPDDVWEYKLKDNTWQAVKVKGAAPPRRAYHSTVFDEKQGVVWMFGGAGDGFAALGDLWKFDPATSSWTAATPSGEKPAPRFSAGLHYDSANHRLVLYSGCKVFFENDNAWPDVWIYDIAKNAWSKQKTAAPARWQAATALAPELGLLVVQGGFDGKSTAHADTWIYSIADDKWTEAGKGFKATEAHGAVWDPIAHAMIVFGGTSGSKAGLDQLWSFDPKSKKWSQLATKGDGPGGRAYHALVWNPTEKSIWTFGGTLNQFMDEPRKNEAWSVQLHK